MNGAIWVESEPGAGSTFAFEIEVGADAAARNQKTPAPGARSVLVAAKNTKSRSYLLNQLRGLGLQAAAVDCLPGPDGWGRDSALAADVLLADSNILGACAYGAGSTWAQQLDAAWPCRVLLVGAVGGMSDYAKERGFGHFLAKPVRRKALLQKLDEVLLGRAPAAATAQAATNGHEGETMPLCILLAEDNIDNQKLIARMIKKLGHEVDTVTNGKQAAEAVSTKLYDVVLMDLHMPVLDGLEATRLIRQMPQERSPRILALTADAMQETRLACQAAGMDGWLCKPLKFDQLTRMLRSATLN
jgi:CheY-like chemotaxis protein